MAGIQRIVAVASGKGGVGKSTVSVNLACALHHLGVRVGLLDCDIYGPSIPLMTGVHDRPAITPEQKMVPLENHGVKPMSMGFLPASDDQPVIWRGPMIMKTIQQFFSSVVGASWTCCWSICLRALETRNFPSAEPMHTWMAGWWSPRHSKLHTGYRRKEVAMFQKVNVPILGMADL